MRSSAAPVPDFYYSLAARMTKSRRLMIACVASRGPGSRSRSSSRRRIVNLEETLKPYLLANEMIDQRGRVLPPAAAVPEPVQAPLLTEHRQVPA